MSTRGEAKEYRLRAQHCLDIACDLDSGEKMTLLDMAQAWLRLADQAERNQRNDLVYETPNRAKSKVQMAPSKGA